MTLVEDAAHQYEASMAESLRLRAEMITACRTHLDAGYSEVQVAQWAHVSRTTLRKWIGKQPCP